MGPSQEVDLGGVKNANLEHIHLQDFQHAGSVRLGSISQIMALLLVILAP